MLFRQIADDALAQYAYLVGCQQTGEALVIDPERDVDRYLELAGREGLRIVAAAETHIHADFLSGARELAHRVPGLTLYLSDEGGPDWRYAWARDPRYRTRFLDDGDTFGIGGVEVRAVHTPGHTPEHLSFLITDRGAGAGEPMGLASGDFVFAGDLGRPDLLETAAGQRGAMEPAARRLYGSARAFLDLPDHLQVWPGHGAGSACGKALGAVPVTTVGYEKRMNAALDAARRDEDGFVRAILAGQPEPPLYFARMKRLNRDGAPVLGELPRPARVGLDELGRLAADPEAVVLDTRLDRADFFAGHLPGSIFAPLDKTFPTIAGSYVEPGRPIVLVADDAKVEAAVRALVRIGLDDVRGWLPPADLARWAAAGGRLATLESIGMAELERRRLAGEVAVLDVRGAAERAARHVPGSFHVAHVRLPERLGELPADRPLAVHCASGARAASAASLLARQGFQVIHAGGRFADWAPAPAPAGTAEHGTAVAVEVG